MKILICNAGSTSLKFQIFQMPEGLSLATGRIERVGSKDKGIFHYLCKSKNVNIKLENQNILTYSDGIYMFLSYLTDAQNGIIENIDEIQRVGFKTVLAKGYYKVHELVPEVLDAMDAYMSVAPAHNGPYLEAIKEFNKILPNAMKVGAFETAFHATIPLERKVFGIPYDWYEKYGIQKLGYHGASHEFISLEVAKKEGKTGNVISCHLGGSGSICAIKDGKSVDNSFGFSLQTGTIHSNRVGDLDSFVIPFLLEEGLTLEEIKTQLSKNGGLLGISGISNDLREVEESAEAGNERAKLAIDVYCNGIIRYIGSYYAELGGLDHIVFTGGIGENSKIVRKIVLLQLKHFGIELDENKNDNIPDDGIITTANSKVKVHIIPTDEEQIVAKKTFEC